MLVVKELRKSFDNFELLIDDFKITAGKNVALVGVNGAGKSTFIKCITNYIKDYSGDIFINDEKYTGYEQHISALIGYMSENLNFIEDLNAGDQLKIAETLSPNWDPRKCENLVKQLKFDLKVQVKNLSKGNRAKLGLIIALCRSAKLIILDEPTSGLDPVMKEFVINEIKHLKDQNISVLISSHNLDDIKDFADEIVIIKNGKLIIKMLNNNLMTNGEFKNEIISLLK